MYRSKFSLNFLLSLWLVVEYLVISGIMCPFLFAVLTRNVLKHSLKNVFEYALCLEVENRIFVAALKLSGTVQIVQTLQQHSCYDLHDFIYCHKHVYNNDDDDDDNN